jgi:hypothetical protein
MEVHRVGRCVCYDVISQEKMRDIIDGKRI